MKHFLFVPVKNRLDLAENALKSVNGYTGGVFVVDNTENGIGDIFCNRHVVRLDPLFQFSQIQEWIRLFAIRQGYDYYFFLHNDGIVRIEDIEEMQILADTQKDWGIILSEFCGSAVDVLSCFNVEAVKSIGAWDKFLTWYYSDTDYYRRMELSKYKVIRSSIEVGHANGASSTLKSDKEIERYVYTTFPLYERYYREKWGGIKGQEKYTVPFNLIK